MTGKASNKSKKEQRKRWKLKHPNLTRKEFSKLKKKKKIKVVVA